MSAVLEHHGKDFSPIYVHMVRAGEASGALDQILFRLAEFLEKQLALRTKVTNAILYPALMLVDEPTEGLAPRIVDDVAQALATLREYNAAVMRDVPFVPSGLDGRGTQGLALPKSNWANVLDTPPYEAFGVTCGITFTFGGLRINHENGQVLDVGYEPIPGLYAAGEMVGGIFYFNYPAGTGLVSGLVFGRIAGSGAAVEAKAR